MPLESPRAGELDAELAVRPELVNPALTWLAELDAESFRRLFRQSPVQRAKLSGLLRNVAIAMGNSGLDDLPAQVARMGCQPRPGAGGSSAMGSGPPLSTTARVREAQRAPVRV